jgi:hypothetical protein
LQQQRKLLSKIQSALRQSVMELPSLGNTFSFLTSFLTVKSSPYDYLSVLKRGSVPRRIKKMTKCLTDILAPVMHFIILNLGTITPAAIKCAIQGISANFW